MSKKNKPIRAKLIANPGAGDILEAASRIKQVTNFLLEYGLKVDVALAKPKKEAIPIAKKANNRLRFQEGFNKVKARNMMKPKKLI